MLEQSTDQTELPRAAHRPGQGALLLSSCLGWLAAAMCVGVMCWQPTAVSMLALGLAVLAIFTSDQLRRRAFRRATLPANRSITATAASGDVDEARRELSLVAQQLEQRERQFAERLGTFHEWMEFPEPIQLADVPTTENDVEQAKQWSKNDEMLFAVIEEETETLFNGIRDNKYTVDGKLNLGEARLAAERLIQRVARIYQPDADEPLLETSAALILRSMSRASLQLLVVLEQLPLDVKEHSISKLYGYVQTAVKYYGMYKAARPYFPWASNAMYIGRYAMGASPLTLGAWYATGKLGTEIAKVATQRIVNQQALQVVQNVVRLTAFEVAQAYGGDFRQRDPNWIYAAELTHMVSMLPASARTLTLALGEVGALQLRSEYDRVWFYRCLAAGKPGGDAKRFSLGLEGRERLQVANRLERFVEGLPNGQDAAIAQWRSNAEDRLGIKLGAVTYAGGEAAVEQAVRSLAGFLLEVKQRPEHLWLLDLADTACLPLASQDVPERLRESPPFLFEYPDLAPGSELAEKYMADLMKLAASLPNRGPDVLLMLEEIGAYLRLESDYVNSAWHQALQVELRLSLGERLRGEPPAGCAAITLDYLEQSRDTETADAVYWPASTSDHTELVLVLVDKQVTAWSVHSAEPVWKASCQEVRAEKQRGVLGSNCQLRAPGLAVLTIEGASWTRYQRYFEPLLKRLPPGP